MKITSRPKAVLLLEDGAKFEGYSIGRKGTHGGEICFNTGMTGYQEVYTDPSYFGQVVVNTTPHIGNYGAIDAEQESESPKISGLVVNEYAEVYSRFTAASSLQEYLDTNGVVGIAGVDTRKIVRHIRSKGAMNCIISSELDNADLEAALKDIPSMDGLELASVVSTKEVYERGEGNQIKVAVLDLGVKKSILDNLVERGAHCKVFPAKTSYSEMVSWKPDGYFISNGPGDPAEMDYAVETVSQILSENEPLFGICLGHQVLARANNVGTYKMHHGHRGLNHPVKNLINGRCEVTSQNHGFAVNKDEVDKSTLVDLTHVNLNDDTAEGLSVNGKRAFSVQYHPESSPGPHDSRYLFDDFISMMNAN